MSNKLSREEIDKILKTPFSINYIEPVIRIGFKGKTKQDTINVDRDYSVQILHGQRKDY